MLAPWQADGVLLERPACQPRLGLGTLTAFRAFHFQHRSTGLLFRLMFLLLLHGAAPVSWFGPLFVTCFSEASALQWHGGMAAAWSRADARRGAQAPRKPRGKEPS